MSEGRKRSRKTKLEVRNDIDMDDTENTILQVLPKAKALMPRFLQPKILDHTYSLQDAPAPSSPIQLSVKVEVEEFDESIMGTDSVKASDDVSPKLRLVAKNIVTNNKRRSRAMIRVFQVDIEKMYKISEHIIWSSTNPADKILDMEMRNVWGRLRRSLDDIDPYNELIQKVLLTWGLKLINGKTWRESPIFYQCHICNLAWWFLDPFRKHIRRHDHTKLKVYHLEDYHESVIVASKLFSTVRRYIRCEGNCYRCGKAFESHVKTHNHMYMCIECNELIPTCTLLQNHQLLCFQRKLVQVPKTQKCSLCSATFCYEEDLLEHMPTAHAVRSDVPAPFSFKTCTVCQKKYYYFYTHVCLKSTMAASCPHCYRRFSTKLLADWHASLEEKNYTCKICNQVLALKCMEAQHMLLHTDNYRVAYKCISPSCAPTMLFPDENSVKLHRSVYHKVKFDKRRAYFEMVLIPEKCAKPEFVLDSDHVVACWLEEKGKKPDAPSTSVNEESKTANSKTDKPADKEFVLEFTQIKQEIEEMECVDSDKQKGDSHEGDMDYEQMLSKVFKVSESVLVSKQPCDTTEIDVIIKQEQEEVDFENLIDMQDDPITIKKEPIETDVIYEMCTEEVCDIDETSYMIATCDVKIEPHDDTGGFYDTGVPGMRKTDVTAIKMEPEDIHEEMFEGSDIKIMNTFTQKPDPVIIRPTPLIEPIAQKKSIKTLFKACKDGSFIVKSLNSNALKGNASENNTTEATTGEQGKIVKKLKDTKSLKSNGVRQQRLYTCTKCGYMNKHKLYSIHRRSECELSPTVDHDNKYKCTKCDSTFGTLKSYLVHFPKHGYGLLHCPACNMKFESLKEFLPHFHRHVRHNYVNCWMISKKLEAPTMKQQRCQLCRGIVSPENFFAHWEDHLVLKTALNDEGVEAPPEANTYHRMNINSDKSLQPTVLHVALHQLRTIGRDKECFVCNRIFLRRHDCKRHIIEHLLLDAHAKKVNMPNKTLRCQICYQDFLRAEQYKFHMREHGSLPVYRCELCNKTFSDSSNFAKHKKIHSLKVLICDICSKKYHAKSSLVKHIMMHQETEPIKCERCPKEFYSESQFKKHMKGRHLHSIKFKCILCDLSFDSLREKWDHAWTTHKERKQKADCPLCNVQFRKFHDVKTHARADHNVEISFYNTKSDTTVNIMKTYCKISKVKVNEKANKQKETIVVRPDSDPQL